MTEAFFLHSFYLKGSWEYLNLLILYIYFNFLPIFNPKNTAMWPFFRFLQLSYRFYTLSGEKMTKNQKSPHKSFRHTPAYQFIGSTDNLQCLWVLRSVGSLVGWSIDQLVCPSDNLLNSNRYQLAVKTKKLYIEKIGWNQVNCC